MARGKHDFARDVTLRAAGLMMLAAGALALRGLVRLVDAPPRHAASAAELGAAALAFLGPSLGAALACLGARVLDEVEVSARWARRR